MTTIGKVIEELQHYDPDTPCANDLWLPDDVLDLAPDLTDEQVAEVLHSVDKGKDASMGISWDTLDVYIDMMFPDTRRI